MAESAGLHRRAPWVQLRATASPIVSGGAGVSVAAAVAPAQNDPETFTSCRASASVAPDRQLCPAVT
jgi:hypothetical protein